MANSNKKQVREPPSVPFLWEERPGIPKKDWKPPVSSTSSFPAPPVLLIASVPFKWEEKPGTPLQSFSEQPTMLKLTSCSPNNDGDGESMIQSELEAFDFETDDSFTSAPSLLANCLISSTAISTAVPADSWTETPSSPASESGSSTSSYATGASSLVGASFLEWLFPLIPANTGFLEKVGQSDNSSLTPPEPTSAIFDREGNGSVIVRRPKTLGELIMMSRKGSYRRKAECINDRNSWRIEPLDAVSSEVASR